MQVFGRIYERLTGTHGLVAPGQVHTPTTLPDDAVLGRVHCPEYLAAFSGGTLDEQKVRRIGKRVRQIGERVGY
jgi:hypothetical protein